MSSIIWTLGFALMMISFSFLLNRAEPQKRNHRPRISVEPWWPDGDS